MTVLVATAPPLAAAGRRAERAAEAVAPRVAGAPVMAIVSLRRQRVTVYDADGWTMRAPVSSGRRGRETPAGVFSVIQKNAEHYSNLYDDAYMPHMQRITWSGIALHGGPLPGYPASHGCIRLPYGFAERLFERTRLGMRVIVAPGDAAPVAIAHPALFTSKPDAGVRAAELAAEAALAASKANAARLAAVAAARASARAMVAVRVAANLKARAETQLVAAEAAVATASDGAKAAAQAARTKAASEVAALQARWDAANAELQSKAEALAPSREAAAAAEATRAAAAKAARDAAQELEPVSIFISRKSQKLYARRGFVPLFDSPVTIREPDRPIGTHVFTAMARTDAGLRWSVVSLDGASAHAASARTRASDGSVTDAGAAKSALDRLEIPQEVIDRIAPMVWPKTSLIVSDEPLSTETGKGTEFVAVLSNTPQGGLAMRRRPSEIRTTRQRDRLFDWRPPFGAFPTW